jgi:hypothetical protein
MTRDQYLSLATAAQILSNCKRIQIEAQEEDVAFLLVVGQCLKQIEKLGFDLGGRGYFDFG